VIEIDLHKNRMSLSNPRVGISAEVYGEFNIKKEFVPKVIPKSEDQINRIKVRIVQSFIFSNLDSKELQIVINAMEEKSFKAHEVVIKQGEPGDCLYVVDSGELNCNKKFVRMKLLLFRALILKKSL
jgi:cAMP-dependent protein kinase regulator